MSNESAVAVQDLIDDMAGAGLDFDEVGVEGPDGGRVIVVSLRGRRVLEVAL